MSFINGSHRIGVLGAYHLGDVRNTFPEIRALETSEPVNYEAGDVTVHSVLTAHGAGRNLTDRPRWAYLILTQPSDARWLGAPSDVFGPDGMELNQPLPDERFPVIG
jgi:ectoine hydroxylase-related dioxygenase (phytanoyl-CoA dioxygenase family)